MKVKVLNIALNDSIKTTHIIVNCTDDQVFWLISVFIIRHDDKCSLEIF